MAEASEQRAAPRQTAKPPRQNSRLTEARIGSAAEAESATPLESAIAPLRMASMHGCEAALCGASGLLQRLNGCIPASRGDASCGSDCWMGSAL